MKVLHDGIGIRGSHKTPPIVMVRENIEARPITSRTRTGRAFLIDTFEEYTAAVTEKWVQRFGTLGLATDFPKQGKSCMSLTTGATAADVAHASVFIGCPIKTRIGIEFDFMCNSLMADVTALFIGLIYYDGTESHDASVKYLCSTDIKWQYQSSPATWTDITGGSQNIYFSISGHVWNNVKFVADIKAEEFVSLSCNELDLDLSGLNIVSGANPSAPYLDITFGIINENTGAARVLRVDNVILTDEEP